MCGGSIEGETEEVFWEELSGGGLEWGRGGWIGGGGWIRRGTIKVASEELLLVGALLGKPSTQLALGRPEQSSTSFKNVLNLRLS